MDEATYITKNLGGLPADAVGYLQYYAPITNCCQADDSQNYVLEIWVCSRLYSALSLSLLFSTGRNKVVEKSTFWLKWNGFLLTRVGPLYFCSRFLSCEKGLRRQEDSCPWRHQTGAQHQASAVSGGLPLPLMWVSWPEDFVLLCLGNGSNLARWKRFY